MKPGFHELPPVRPYLDGVTWYLEARLVYVRNSGETIIVPTRFETDWASVPRIFQNIIAPWGKYGWAAGLHDWRYWVQSCSRKEADDTLLEAMIMLGTTKWQRLAIYYAVRLFGWIAWRDNARLALEGYSRIRATRGPANRPTWKRKMLRSAFMPTPKREASANGS